MPSVPSSSNPHTSGTMPSFSSPPPQIQNSSSRRMRIGNREQSPPKPLPPIPYDVTVDIDTFIHTPEDHHNLRATNKNFFQHIQEDDDHAFQIKWDAFLKDDNQDRAHALGKQVVNMSFNQAYDAVFSIKNLEKQIQIIKAFSKYITDNQTHAQILKLIRRNPEAKVNDSLLWGYNGNTFLSLIGERYLYLTQTTAEDEASPTSFLGSLEQEDFVELCTFVIRKLGFFTHDQFSLFQSHIHSLDKNYAHLHQVCQKALENANDNHYHLLGLLPIQEQNELIKESSNDALSSYAFFLSYSLPAHCSLLDVFFEDEAFDRLLRYAKNMGENQSIAPFFERFMDHPKTEQAKEMVKQILINGNNKAFCEYMRALSWRKDNLPSFAMDILFEEKDVLDRFFKLHARNKFFISELLKKILRISQKEETEITGGKRIEALIGDSKLSLEAYQQIERDYLSDTKVPRALREALRKALDKK